MPFTPYSTVAPILGALPGWCPSEEDAQRVLSYSVYEQIYWNEPKVFRLDARGTENKPIYVPTGRTIVETTNRFVAKDFGWQVVPNVGTAGDQQMATQAFSTLFAREAWTSKFATQRRYGLIRGDSAWHIVANPTASPGRRLSLYELDPGSLFYIEDPDNLDRILGVHIAFEWVDRRDNKSYVKRQTYRKLLDDVTGELTGITTETSLYDPSSKWWLTELDVEVPPKPIKVLRPKTLLPAQIRAIPVYHFKNARIPSWNYGSSELRGYERLLAAVNQGISDEELTLALDGIGVYATDSGPPLDSEDNETDWVLGPGRVVEIATGSSFTRVGGVGSVQPFQDHIAFLKKELFEASGTPDVARGLVDISVVTSGVALKLQMGPMLARVDEKNDLILDEHTRMFFDLCNYWFPAYEQLDLTQVSVIPTVGDTLPKDNQAKVQEILQIVASQPQIVSAAWARQQLTEVGYEFPANEADVISSEQTATAVAADPFGSSLSALDQQSGNVTGVGA